MSTGYHVYSEKQQQNPMPKRMRGASATELKLKLGLARTVERLHKFQLIVAVSALVFLLLMPTWADAAVTVFTDPTEYFAAAGAQMLQDFNSPSSHTDTSITYPGLVVSCSGGPEEFCDARSFGTSSSVAITGLSIFATGPAPVTFTFDRPVNSFGVYVAGLGSILPGSATLSVSTSNGFFANAIVDHSSTTNDFNVFVGLLSDQPFTSITFIDSEFGDGIFFDNAYYGLAAPVFAGTPGKADCHGKSVSALAQQYGGLNNAAAVLNYPSVAALQDAIQKFCGR